MANTLTGLIPTLYESLDVVSREYVGFIPNVMRDNGNFARAAKGQLITVFNTPTVTAADIVPGVTAPNDGDQVMTSLTMSITKSRYIPIRWNGEEQLGLNNNGAGYNNILTNQFTQAFRALANEMENDLANAAIRGSSRASGVAGTTPFGIAGNLSDVAGINQTLDENGAPMNGRTLVVNSPTMYNIRGVQNVLFKVNEAGTQDLLRNGTIGRLESFDIGYAPQMKSFIKGTGAGYVTGGSTLPIGTLAIPVVTGTGTVNPGDVVTFAGDPKQYVVNTGIAAPGTLIIGGPGLRTAIAAGTAMTVGNSYAPNIGFTRDALILATRKPAVPIDLNGQHADMADDRMEMVDPFTGIAYEISVYRQYRQIKFEVALAWGVANIKPEHVATLLS